MMIDYIYADDIYKLKWNIGLKFFAVSFLVVSSYYWFLNFDKTQEDFVEMNDKMELLGTVPAKDVIDDTAEYVKTSILNINTIKEKNTTN